MLYHYAIRRNKVPQPFSSVPLPEEVEYLNDIRVYDTQHLAWHGVRARGRSQRKEENIHTSSNASGISVQGGEEEEGECAMPEGRYGKLSNVQSMNTQVLMCILLII